MPCRMKVHPVNITDRSALVGVAVRTGLFSLDDAEALLGGILDQLTDGSLPLGHAALACRDTASEAVIGWTYFAPDQHADGVWNVWWLGVDPEAHGAGAGPSLLRAAEAAALSGGARIVVIETSSKDSLARARRFYSKQGYRECGVVPDFYSDGDHKVIFSRQPRETEPSDGAESR
jgi:ribosomal protein S18 acetylase RimI-like enzyme